MKSMNQFGSALHSYEGLARVKLEGAGNSIESKAYFEAAQFLSGRVHISMVPTNVTGADKASFKSDHDSELAFEGQDLNGWDIKISGQAFYSLFSWLLRLASGRPDTVNLGAHYMHASLRGASATGYYKARFLVSNLLWNGDFRRQPESLELKVQDFKVEVKPIDDYVEVAQRLESMNGVEPTAHIWVQSSPRALQPLEIYQILMEDLLYVLRLVTGNKIDWYYGETYDDQKENPVERVHKYATPGPYSNTISFERLGGSQESALPKLNLDSLTKAFFNKSGHVLDRDTMNPLINQFTTSCDKTLYLESRGLIASTLIELIAAKYAKKKGTHEVVSRSQFMGEVYPKLKEAIEDTSLSEDTKGEVESHVRGAYRSSFRRKLRVLNDEFELGLDEAQIDRIVRTRNALVHEGTYPSSTDDGGSLADYELITWINLCALCKLLGYSGQLPAFREAHGVEV